MSAVDGEVDQVRKERPLPTISQTRWYQSDIERAVSDSDMGRLQAAARLSRALRRDGVLGGVLSTRTGGLARLPKRFRGTEQVIAALTNHDETGVGLFDQIFSPKELSLMAGDGILLGVGVGELIQLPWRRAPIFVRLDPEHLWHDWSSDRWYYNTEHGPVMVRPGDGRWVLHTPGGYLNPWQNGLWASLARSYVAKDHAFHYRENYSGKLANPARVAVAPQGATEPQRQSWFQKVMAWGVNTVFGMTPGYDVKLLEIGGRGYEVFAETITTSNEEIIISLAGQMVTVTGGAGFQNSNIHATIRSDLVQDDGDGMGATINSQALPPVINRLFGADARGSVEWDTRPPADLEAEANAMTAAAGAIREMDAVLGPSGLRVDVREMATRYRVPVIVSVPEQITSEAANDDEAVDVTDDAQLEGEGADEGEPITTDEASAALAAKMTEYRIARCEHGKANRCWLCGIERTRDFETGPDGLPRWAVAWRSIAPEVAA